MENTSKLSRPKKRDTAYYRQRQKNRVFTELTRFFAEEAERRGLTKKDLAEAMAKDPAQISRWLSAPSNFELDTLSDFLLTLGAEMDHRIVRFVDRTQPNARHPLVPARETVDQHSRRGETRLASMAEAQKAEARRRHIEAEDVKLIGDQVAPWDNRLAKPDTYNQPRGPRAGSSQ